MVKSDTTVVEIIDLHPNEIALIKTIRRYRYGEVIIIMRDGFPARIERIHESIGLDQKGG